MGAAVTLYDFNGDEIELNNVQKPLALDGDSVYVKDIDTGNSDIGDFSGEITDLFDSLLTVVHNTTAAPIKTIKIWFNRSIQVSSIGFGCNDLSHTFSNIAIKALGSGEEVRFTQDYSSDDTKRNSYVIDLPPLAANGFLFEFHTTDDVCLSNLIIFKSVNVNARLQGVKPDSTLGDVNVTADNNLRVTDAESGLAIAKGDVSVTSFVHKFGKAPDFDSGDGFVTVWDGADDGHVDQMLYQYSTTADIDSLSSDSNSDTFDIEVQGLDTDYNLLVQTVTLTGRTRKALPTSLIRVFRMKNVGADDNVGHIFCFVDTALSSGTPVDSTKIRAVMQPGNNQTLMAIYTVPNGVTGYMRDWFASTAGAKKDTSHEVRLFARPLGQVFQLKHDSSLISDGTSYIQHQYTEPEVFSSKTDIEMRANTGQDGSAVSGGFDVVLVND
ncbi:MAG: hypothetical protein GY799_21335 [Desulfobulbaceae bacterium]|nr:hypothetical protein [Desulfobulbaceae bacterium]